MMRGSASLLALTAFAAMASGQEQALETVVVTGTRAALESAVSIKRNADTVVDSITATDIGVFPDKSVSDAIQRVPGITVSHLQSDDDTTHPSGEATGVLVRGLTFVRTNFNGRDSFSADGHRGLNVNDVSPEMIGGIDVYKNQTADMIEGGIAGIVNIRTRMPFDAEDHILAASAKMNYNDRSDVVTYDYSGVAGKNFDTEYGRFGVLLGYANSHVVTQTNSVVSLRNGTFCSAGATNPDGSAKVGTDGTIPCSATPYGGSTWQYIPDQVNFSRVNYNRKREGKSFALQYENPAKSLRWNFQYNESNYRNAWLEHSSNINMFGMWAAPGFNPMATQAVMPAFGTSPFTFNSNGTLKSGVIASPLGSWMGNWGGSYQHAVDAASVVPGLPYVNYCGPDAGHTCANTATNGVTLENQSRVFDHSEGTRDFSTNLQWDATEKLHFTVDGQYISAKTGNNDMLVANDVLVNAKYERDGSGPPTITLLPGDNVNYAPGFLTNAHNYYSAFVQDHKERNNAQEIALRGDVEYDINNGWLSSIKAGVRYANRKQVVRYSAYNWSPVTAPYMCNGPAFSIDNTSPSPYPASCGNSNTFQGYGANIWEKGNFGPDFYNGTVFNPGDTVWLKNSVLTNPDAAGLALGQKTTQNPGSWTPICYRAGATDCYLPSEVLNVTEKTTAGYLMVSFGGDSLAVFGVPVSGNIGARYIQTELTSTGGISFPTHDWYANNTLPSTPACNAPVTGNNVTNISCWLSAGLGAFSNGGSGLNSYGKTTYNLLPSANIRFDLTDNSIVRFAVSEAMSRPDFGYLRNYVGISAPNIDVSNTSPYVVYNSPTAAHTPANVTGYNFLFIANAGNPALKPMTSWQYDATFEHYFSPSSSFTAGLFLKELNNSIAYGEVTRAITNNGSTQNILVRGPVNSPNGGELWGFELAYQSFFDFLPAPFDGLGTQLNYIHTHQAGIHNSNLAVQPGYIAGSTIAFGGGLQVDNAVIDSHRLAGISDDSYNIIALYEKGPIGVRLAYNYRSSFLTDNLDCCTGTPMYQKGAGFLDGSVRYSVNDHWEVSLDGSNLLDTPIVFQQQVIGDTSLSPKAKPVILDTGWSKSGRLLQFAVRVKY
ncbi:TonB-dependent receptor [Rhizomicrobium palustre]|uniref:TonB-dependent receptor n=1 Tax=Rhizomicrobium palustre TaxID=189966 RepID=A0A846N062_9PROT|nr:TonB-dependent receptor [Rhizomicrobium palustre]NIK88889.1 TonB-dependent receptor [Rhizomicrobium palustre]